MKSSLLYHLGWNQFFEDQLDQLSAPDHLVGRVAIENRTNFTVLTGDDEYIAEASGRLFYMASTDAELPKVGDWVLMLKTDSGRAIIDRVLERKSAISRKVAGKKVEEQILAANVDRLFIVQGLDNNFNIARLERYLALAQSAEPVIVLNKADLCAEPAGLVQQVMERIKNVPVVSLSAYENVAPLADFIKPEQTIAFVGSSGVGKSTLINKLLQEEHLATGTARSKDAKGRHTTTRRELVILPQGGLLIDTPGMRELQLWGETSQLSASFEDIEAEALHCRFSNCTHGQEAGCAIRAAIASGLISEAHWANYQKMKRELDYLATKTDKQALLEQKNKWKKIHKNQREMYKRRNS